MTGTRKLVKLIKSIPQLRTSGQRLDNVTRKNSKIYGLSKDSKAAVKHLTDAHELQPDSLPTLKSLFAALLSNNETERLVETLKKYQDLWSKDKDFGHGVTIGYYAGQAKSYKMAEEVLNATRAKHPTEIWTPTLRTAVFSSTTTKPARQSMYWNRPTIEAETPSLNVLKVYANALSKAQRTTATKRCAARVQGECWEPNKEYGHGITLGVYASMNGMEAFAIEVLQSTIQEHPTKLTPTLRPQMFTAPAKNGASHTDPQASL